MNERALGKMQVGSPAAGVHPLAEADLCLNSGGGITLTFKTRSPDCRVRLWIEPEGVAVLLRQLFGQTTLSPVVKHPDVLRLAKLIVTLAESGEAH